MKPVGKREWAGRLAALRSAIEDALESRAPGLLGERPVGNYLAFFDALPERALYHAVPPEARAWARAIEARAGPEGLEAYLRLATVALLERDEPSFAAAVTDELLALRRQWLERIADGLERPRGRYYRHSNDSFAKDFAVCRGKLLPGGVELLDPGAGVPRRLIIAGGASKAPSALAFFLGRMGGFAPVCDLHFDRRLIGEFDEEGYARLYRRVAGLLEINPRLRGVVSFSWWHDPALARIGPELGFIGRHPENAGARLFRFGENAASTADATRFAPRRTELWRAGSYRPCVYLLAWPRADLLAWARGRRAEGAAG